MDKTHTANRDTTPFVVRVRHRDGETRDHTVGAVIDASGTWSRRNPLGTSGLPAMGEDEFDTVYVVTVPTIGKPTVLRLKY